MSLALGYFCVEHLEVKHDLDNAGEYARSAPKENLDGYINL